MENSPLYIRIDQYQELTAAITKLDAKLQGVEKSVGRIMELKREEDEQLRAWNDTLADIKERAARITEATRR